jgi:hypothetical protein
MKPALFDPGQVVATPAALVALTAHGVLPSQLLDRHVSGDDGDMDEEDKEENKFAIRQGDLRIFSSYNLPPTAATPDGPTRSSTPVRVWVITEADRSVTTLLLPEEY